MEIGGSPLGASLRMDLPNREEFKEACNSNTFWREYDTSDREGNIGWQSAGTAPIRKN